MARGIVVALVPLLTFSLAPAAFAQAGSEDGAKTLSWFEMFFFPPGDPIGALMIWVILAMSAISISLIIRFSLQYRRAMMLPDATRAEIEALLSDKKYRDAIEYASNDPSYLGRVTSSALSEASNGYGAMERAIEEAGDAEVTKMLRPVEYLNVLGNIAPMMGLFGTVYGMIVAFQSLVAAGGRPNPADLAGGIATALVTTFWGLVVAIPALAAYAVIRNRIDALTTEGLVMAEDIISPFKPGGKKEKPERERSAERPDRPDRPATERRPRATPKPEAEE